jgi:tetratricopeptide (TPR) repeat protein
MVPKNKPLTRRVKITLALGSPVLFFLFLEIILRLCGFGHSTGFTIRRNFNGEDYHVPNPWFTAPYFPKQNPRQTEPFAISVNKPEGTMRVLVLGASAAQGDPKTEFGFHRMLDRSLTAKFPHQDISVHNLGITAINSHIVKEIAHECRDLEANHWIIYLGNNEVIGPFGPANPSFSMDSYGAIRKIRLTLAKSRSGQLLNDLLVGNPLKGERQIQWLGMESFLQPVQWGSQELEAVYENYQANLENIVDSGQASGAEILLCTVAVNLQSCAPLNPSKSAVRAWEAREYGKARDLDGYRFRADSRINGIIKKVAENKQCTLVDVAAVFERLESENDNLFHDHVHFTFEGNRALTQILAKEIGGGEIPTDLQDSLAYTKFERQNILKVIRGRLVRPPFLHQGVNGLSIEKLGDRIQALAPAGQKDLEDWDRIYLAAIASYPQDVAIRLNYANFLLNFQRGDLAREHCEKALALAAWNPDVHYNIALCKAEAGNMEKARKHLEEALGLQPFDHLARSLLGNFLTDSQPEEAIR